MNPMRSNLHVDTSLTADNGNFPALVRMLFPLLLCAGFIHECVDCTPLSTLFRSWTFETQCLIAPFAHLLKLINSAAFVYRNLQNEQVIWEKIESAIVDKLSFILQFCIAEVGYIAWKTMEHEDEDKICKTADIAKIWDDAADSWSRIWSDTKK